MHPSKGNQRHCTKRNKSLPVYTTPETKCSPTYDTRLSLLVKPEFTKSVNPTGRLSHYNYKEPKVIDHQSTPLGQQLNYMSFVDTLTCLLRFNCDHLRLMKKLARFKNQIPPRILQNLLQHTKQERKGIIYLYPHTYRRFQLRSGESA